MQQRPDMTHKASNIYYRAFYLKSFPTSGLQNEIKLIKFLMLASRNHPKTAQHISLPELPHSIYEVFSYLSCNRLPQIQLLESSTSVYPWVLPVGF